MKLLLKKTNPGNLPYVSLYHGTHLYNFIVDTGSTCNWIDTKTMSNFLQEGDISLKKRVLNFEEHDVVTATLRVEPRKYTEEDDVEKKFRAAFVNGHEENFTKMNDTLDFPIDGILGMEFLDENCAAICLENMYIEA